MLTNADITIYNRWYNTTTRLDEWHKTQISGVNWYGGQAVTVGDKGLVSASTYKVRIPASSAPDKKSFVAPDVYSAAAADALAVLWTFQDGDVIACGLIDTDVPKNITGEHFTVTGWADNRRGGLPHWKVDGK